MLKSAGGKAAVGPGVMAGPEGRRRKGGLLHQGRLSAWPFADNLTRTSVLDSEGYFTREDSDHPVSSILG